MTMLQKIYRAIRESAPLISKADARYAAIRMHDIYLNSKKEG